MWLAPHIFAWMWSNGSLALIIGFWLFGGIILGMASLGSLLKLIPPQFTQALPDAIFDA